jgi:hypothetical protein
MIDKDIARAKNSLIKQVRVARLAVSIFGGVLASVFAWLQLKHIDFGPIKNDVSAITIFRLAFILYYAGWAVGLPWDASDQELVYIEGPGMKRVVRDAIFIGFAVTAVFFLMLWVNSLETFARLLATFLVVNVLSWQYLIKSVLPRAVTVSKSYYSERGDHVARERLNLFFDKYLTGTWQWRRFLAGGVLVTAINITASVPAVVSLFGRLGWSAQMAVSLELLAYVIVMEAWIWAWRLKVKVGLSQLDDIGERYGLSPHTRRIAGS